MFFLIFVYNNCYNPIAKPHKFTTTSLQASFLDWPHIWEIITNVRHRENSGEILWECDYSCITSAILPYYFPVTTNNIWVITPEYNHLEGNHPDYTIFKVNNYPFKLEIYAVVEIKSKTGKSWHFLLEQMCKQAEVGKNDSGKLWAIGQKGVEICFFKFDLQKYLGQDPNCYTFFEPLNLSHLSVPQLDNLKVKYEECNNHGFARIALIKWRLDNRDHIPYIHHMFEHIRNLKP